MFLTTPFFIRLLVKNQDWYLPNYEWMFGFSSWAQYLILNKIMISYPKRVDSLISF